jgi:hypothetical protein
VDRTPGGAARARAPKVEPPSAPPGEGQPVPAEPREEPPRRIPDLFLLGGLSGAEVTPAPLPDDVWVFGQEVPISRWLFGQYNKLLPAKASCRALAHLLMADPDGAPLSTAAAQIADAAAHLGDYLTELDEAGRVTRDEALATAFPKSGQRGDKSRVRFATHFVAGLSSHGQLSGLPVGLKLINRTSHREPRIKLTDAGWMFALLRNPVLDATEPRKAAKFSDDECLFLLERIAASVPAEDFAYRAVLRGIDQGANTPETIDAFLVRHYPAGADRLTKEFVATQRSGVVSRMIDLGMLARARDGVRVSYVVSERGHAYLTQQPARRW